MFVNIPKLGNAQLYGYKYDQLNRIVSMDVFKGFDNALNQWTGTPTASTDYKERITYDANGNIKTYLRNGDANRQAMDNMNYTYKAGTNRLDKVVDLATDASDPDYPKYNDIKRKQPNGTMGQATGNYQYDAIGNLISDVSEGITNIEWTIYGKIKKITKSTGNIEYTYDAAGNRISKTANNKTTVYVRDASGNVMSVYEKRPDLNSNLLTQSEVALYGSSRLGMWTPKRVADGSLAETTDNIFTFTRGEKIFELSNHLGNVMVTLSDRKVPVSSNGNTIDYYVADVVSANDYYPFGMSMPGRGYNAGNYRYGFNGKEDNKDISEGGQDYGMRIYDKRLGRFLSTDPLAKSYPMLTAYQFASNSPISGIDLDGLEFYYAADGKFLGQRTNDAKGKPLPKEVMNDVRIASEVIQTKDFTIFKGVKSLNIQHSEFVKFAAIAYGESSVGNGVQNKEEVFAIANTMSNYKKLTGKNSKAYAATDGNEKFKDFNKATDENRNGTFMQTAIAGSINALNGGKDYSNGATHWAGNDIGSKAEKWAEGLKFTDIKHDLFNLGNNAVSGENYWLDKNNKPTKLRGKWDYKWESTAAYSGTTPKGGTSGTTFMKVSSEYKNATGNKGQ